MGAPARAVFEAAHKLAPVMPRKDVLLAVARAAE